MTKLLFSVTVVAAALAAGCGSDPKPPAAGPGGPSTAPTSQVVSTTTGPMPGGGSQKPGDEPTQSNISISDEIRKACGITDTDAFFAFDSANVREHDQGVLTQLARCFSDGALKGREMRLVGHADPRGDSEYNMVLGGRRAENIKSFIATRGLAADRMSTTSRGAMDATGTDEASWAKDRRVDVVLGE